MDLSDADILELKREELKLRAKEIRLSEAASRATQRFQAGTLLTAVVAAAASLGGASYSAYLQGKANVAVEREKLESSLVEDAVKAPGLSQTDVLKQLNFYVRLGYVHNDQIAKLVPIDVPPTPHVMEAHAFSGLVKPVNIAQLLSLHAKLEGRVPYRLGAKADPLTEPPSSITTLDCSGYTRYVLYSCTSPSMEVPDGSQNMYQWCLDEGFPPARYQAAITAGPNHLFMGVLLDSDSPDGLGTVELEYNGYTYGAKGQRGVCHFPIGSFEYQKHLRFFELPCKR